MRSVRFSRVRVTACFMRSKNESFSVEGLSSELPVSPNKFWIIAIAHYTGRRSDAVRTIMAGASVCCLDSPHVPSQKFVT